MPHVFRSNDSLAAHRHKKIATGTHLRWINGGKEIAYWTPPGGIVSTDLVLTDDDIRIGRTRTLVGEPRSV